MLTVPVLPCRRDPMKLPLLTSLEPGLPESVLREADSLVRALSQFAALAQMDEDDRAQHELSQVVQRALPDISAATAPELDELASRVRRYREAVRAALATQDSVLGERLTNLELRIAEVQQIQDQRVVEERLQRIRIEEERDARRLDRLRDSLGGTPRVVKAPLRFFRRRPMSQAEADQFHYQEQLEALHRSKYELASIITEKKRFQLQLEKTLGEAERAVAAVPDVREKHASAVLAFERAVDAVAHRGLVSIYSKWIKDQAAKDGSVKSDELEVDDPLLGEIAEDPSADFDVFISHASEDKDDVVRPLTQALRQRGLKVWLDEQELTLGDSLSRKIDDGLARSRFGVVVLSHAFFRKNWTQRELEGLVSRETMDGDKVILPVWHGVTEKDVYAESPPLANRLAVDAGSGVALVADAIMLALRQPT